jgi:hypothetical protein
VATEVAVLPPGSGHDVCLELRICLQPYFAASAQRGFSAQLFRRAAHGRKNEHKSSLASSTVGAAGWPRCQVPDVSRRARLLTKVDGWHGWRAPEGAEGPWGAAAVRENPTACGGEGGMILQSAERSTRYRISALCFSYCYYLSPW